MLRQLSNFFVAGAADDAELANWLMSVLPPKAAV
jgi:hypothetical protein